MNDIKRVKVVPFILFMNLVAIIIVGYFVVAISIKINRTQDQIEVNQHLNELTTRNYIACLIGIKSPINLQSQEQACFNNAPQVK